MSIGGTLKYLVLRALKNLPRDFFDYKKSLWSLLSDL